MQVPERLKGQDYWEQLRKPAPVNIPGAVGEHASSIRVRQTQSWNAHSP